MKSCLYCTHHKMLDTGRIGDIQCCNPEGTPKIRITITREKIDLNRFNIKDLEKEVCNVYQPLNNKEPKL